MPDATAAATPRLSLRGIRKAYPSVVANDGIDLAVVPGEIHAVLGENGAGKSTLMKIIYGVVKPDAGEILWQGRPVEIANPHAARSLGIGMVFQHFSLFETLTVTENVALGDRRREGPRGPRAAHRGGVAALWPAARSAATRALALGRRAPARGDRALPAAAAEAADHGRADLGAHAAGGRRSSSRRCAQLAAEGCSILYISHKLDEIKALCTGATVLRGGKVTGTCDPRNETASSTGADDDREGPAGVRARRRPPRRRAAAGGRGPVAQVRRSVRHRSRGRAPHGARAARSSASPACRATARRSCSSRSRARRRSRSRSAIRLLGDGGRAHASRPPPQARPGLRARGTSRPRRGAEHVARRERAAHRAPRRRHGARRPRARRAHDRVRARLHRAVHGQVRRARGRRRAACPAATCRSSSSAGRSSRHRRCWSSRSRPGAWTSARRHSSARR